MFFDDDLMLAAIRISDNLSRASENGFYEAVFDSLNFAPWCISAIERGRLTNK